MCLSVCHATPFAQDVCLAHSSECFVDVEIDNKCEHFSKIYKCEHNILNNRKPITEVSLCY